MQGEKHSFGMRRSTLPLKMISKCFLLEDLHRTVPIPTQVRGQIHQDGSSSVDSDASAAGSSGSELTPSLDGSSVLSALRSSIGTTGSAGFVVFFSVVFIAGGIVDGDGGLGLGVVVIESVDDS